ncbi:TonB-dependent receptor plug domain-containing protein [Methylobacter psychrophilus]|uniref:TonB-dependent receptor plug domain-containing protein n=1 Tax=Methylobacter psychrophilus TaxID=96941 RepID=UPI0021D4B080|nr:TonB-dependent receptor [Methylobacter psychrophilus]
MKVKIIFYMKRLAFISYLSSGIAAAAEESVEDFFAMSPAQLAATPVTIATGTPTPVFQSAASTSVVTAEQIKSMGATELHEVLETIPGVHASLQPNSYDYNYSIRGIANSTNSEVLILLNGTRITTPSGGTLMTGTEMPLEAIQRVEVIRGPGSALYGADAFAGVINIITKKAKDINGSVLGVRAGDHGTQSGWGQQSAEWAGWDIATSLQYQRNDGDQGRIVTADAQTGFDNAFGTHASLAPGPMNTNYETYNGHLNLQRKHWDIGFWAFNTNGGTRAGLVGALDPNGNANGQQFLGDVRFSTEDWLDNWELTAHASYQQADFQAQTHAFPNNAELPIGSNGNINASGSSALVVFPNGVNTDLGRKETIPSLELGSIYKGLDKHILRFSTAFRYEKMATNQSSNFGYGVQNGIGGALVNVTGTPYVYLPDTHRTIGSLVAQDEWQLAADWQLTAGLRYDHYSDFGGTFNPRAALVWDINKQLTSKLMYGKAFRAPTFLELYTQNSPVVAGNPDLKPETINTYEWALNYRPISSLSTSANVYYYQISNLIAQVANLGTVASNYQNSGNQNGYGSEVEANWQWNEQWNVKGNYAWQHAINETTKSSVIGVPAQHLYVALVWKFLPQWQLQPQLNWIGSRTGNVNQQLSDYETIDFTLRGQKLFGHLNLAASLRNALDAQYYEPTFISLPATLPMQGRSFYLEASINFDAF